MRIVQLSADKAQFPEIVESSVVSVQELYGDDTEMVQPPASESLVYKEVFRVHRLNYLFY